MDISSISPALFASTFAMIFVAEIPDKTALAALMLATGGRPVAVFAGVAAAFVIQSLVAVLFGSVLGLLPPQVVRIGAGLLFLAFAVAMWRRHAEPEEGADGAARPAAGWWAVAGKAFVVIFIAEWGDLTQLATAALTAKQGQPLTIFLAATLALWAVSALAVALGHVLKHRIRPVLMQRIAAVVFAVIGVLMLYGVRLGG
jgi:putative Ca2+/H+ antiporter (TMEM165/GDT1 family)